MIITGGPQHTKAFSKHKCCRASNNPQYPYNRALACIGNQRLLTIAAAVDQGAPQRTTGQLSNPTLASAQALTIPYA
jgi:predicted metalloenzyme YecM